PEWIGPNPPFWDDLTALRHAMVNRPSGGTRPWLIAATWHTDWGFSEEEKQAGRFLGPYLAPVAPEHRDPAWRFLGFDITDGSFLSGLSDCGYRDDEHDGLAEVWAGRLNRYHLFDDLDYAFQFRALTNRRVPEHAPFFVIGLWLIARISESPEAGHEL
ncbi:MAG TPA: hypothetical protein VGH38_31345, partial [Bryobacteraceae bacterium]